MNQKTNQLNFVYLMIVPDTHYVSVEETPVNRKTEINPIGFLIRFFDSLAEAYKVKAKIERRQYLAAKYLKTY